MQNILKLKNMHLEGFQVILSFLPQNHTRQKAGFCHTGGGRVRKLRTCPQLLGFLRLPLRSVESSVVLKYVHTYLLCKIPYKMVLSDEVLDLKIFLK